MLADCSDPARDVLVVAAGSMPAEGVKLWPAEHADGYHSEYGFSCMGYEIAGGIGVRMAQRERGLGGETLVVVGDGSYLMLNSEIATSVMLGQKLIVLVLDNRGFGCINRLQNACGGTPFNNLLDEGTAGSAPRIDFAAHARALGAEAEHVDGLASLREALARARAASGTYVISLDTNPVDSTGGGAWWQVGVPSVSERPAVVESQQQWQGEGARQQPY